MKPARTPRDNKGFLFEVDDEVVGRARDVRGFADAAAFLEDRSAPKPERLVLVIPTIALEDYLSKWAEDDAHPRRKLTITRRANGEAVSVTATLSAYGYGVETALQLERIAAAAAAAPARTPSAEEVQQSGVHAVPMSRRKASIRRSA